MSGHSVEIRDFVERAEQRFHHDPMFHAKVTLATRVLDADLRQANNGRGLSDFELEVAGIAAAVALVIVDEDLSGQSGREVEDRA